MVKGEMASVIRKSLILLCLVIILASCWPCEMLNLALCYHQLTSCDCIGIVKGIRIVDAASVKHLGVVGTHFRYIIS